MYFLLFFTSLAVFRVVIASPFPSLYAGYMAVCRFIYKSCGVTMTSFKDSEQRHSGLLLIILSHSIRMSSNYRVETLHLPNLTSRMDLMFLFERSYMPALDAPAGVGVLYLNSMSIVENPCSNLLGLVSCQRSFSSLSALRKAASPSVKT